MNVKHIRSHPLLRILPGSLFRPLAEHAVVEERAKGEILFREGEPCTHCFLILSGRCKSYHPLPNGGETPLAILGPGDSLGERDVFHHYGHYRSSAKVITDSLLVRIEAEAIHMLFEKKPRLVHLFTQYLNEKLREEQVSRILPFGHLGRVVTLVSLDSSLACPDLCRALSANLTALTPDPVLLLHLMPDENGLRHRDWGGNVHGLESEFPFETVPGDHRSVQTLRLSLDGSPGETADIPPLLSLAAKHFRYVIIAANEGELPRIPLLKCLGQSDLVYPLIRAEEDCISRLKELAAGLHGGESPATPPPRPVVFFRAGERGPGITLRVEQETGLTPHLFVHGESFLGRRNEEEQLRRIAREIARCRVGLALSTGGACGLAHIGVLQSLAEHGVELDMVAGASMGSWIAAMWGCGLSTEDMEKQARKVEGRWGLLKLIDPVFPPRRGVVKGNRARRRLEQVIRDAHFSDAIHPIRLVATRMDTLESTVFDRGRLSTLVQASSAMPGICLPVNIGGVPYIDAGAADPLPVDVLRNAGIETVIAVNTILTPAEIKRFRALERERGASWGWDLEKPPGFFQRHFNYFAPGNMFDVMMRGFRACQMQVAEHACAQADVVLRVNGPEDTWYEFHNPDKYIAAGREIANRHMEEILNQISMHRHESGSV
jgi:NTE family protein